MHNDPRMNKPYIKLARSCAAGITTAKAEINWRRINKEMNRRNYAIASFVPVPILIKKDGKRIVPTVLRKSA